MTITHKHILTISPNDSAAQKIINGMREELPECQIHETTVAVSIEWYEYMEVLKEGARE